MRKRLRFTYHWLLVPVLLLPLGNVIAEIYRVVDEDGNVIYTDQPPTPDATPMTLRGLSVVEFKATPKPTGDGADEGEAEAAGATTSLRDLRRQYRDFSLVSPTADQTFWGTENQATIAWNAGAALQSGMEVTVYLDGRALPPTTNAAIPTGRLDRGTHRVYAELRDGMKRRVATTDTVSFHVKQFSANFNRPQPTPLPQN